MVIGIMVKPADARAIAPVPRFARFERRGSDDDDDDEVVWETLPGPPLPATNAEEGMRMLDLATCCLSALRVEKYNAEPKPVRMTDGSVPRHSCLRVCGPLTISRKVCTSDAEPDCWTRVFSRSAGWSNEAEITPVLRPAKKWNAG